VVFYVASTHGALGHTQGGATMQEDDDRPTIKKLLSFKDITLVERLLMIIMMLTLVLIATVSFMMILRGH
jgi:hypothetical protein